MAPADRPSTAATRQVDTSTPSIARVYDLMLGGKDNFAVDRAAYDRLVELAPELPLLAKANRAWLVRVVRWLARDAGIDQFLDVGSGLPTVENTHEVAQRVNPEACVVYVDNDPAVLAYGRALLEENDRTHFAAADLTEPDQVLSHPAVTRHLDLSRPVAVMHCLTMHNVSDTGRAVEIMERYVAPLAAGSYLALSHPHVPSGDGADAAYAKEIEARFAETFGMRGRTLDEIASLFPGLELIEPGVVPYHEWWPDGPRLLPPPPAAKFAVCGLARKP